MGSLQNACQAVLHPLESIQLLSGPQQDPCEAPLAEGAAHKAAEEEDDEEPGRLHQVWYGDPDPCIVDITSKAFIKQWSLFCLTNLHATLITAARIAVLCCVTLNVFYVLSVYYTSTILRTMYWFFHVVLVCKFFCILIETLDCGPQTHLVPTIFLGSIMHQAWAPVASTHKSHSKCSSNRHKPCSSFVGEGQRRFSLIKLLFNRSFALNCKPTCSCDQPHGNKQI